LVILFSNRIGGEALRNFNCLIVVAIFGLTVNVCGCQEDPEPAGDDDDVAPADDDDDDGTPDDDDDDGTPDDDDDATVETVTVGSDGGTITVEDVTITIPPGALTSSVDFQASLVDTGTLPALPDGAGWAYSNALVLTPHGQSFDVPVVITLPQTAQMVLQLDDETDDSWEQVLTLYLGEQDTTAFVTSFSIFGWFNGALPRCGDENCDPGEDCDNCPADCNDWEGTGVLHGGDCADTPEDYGFDNACCQQTPITCCGAGTCWGDEDHNWCAYPIMNLCGDGICDKSYSFPDYTEDCENCPEDCGACRCGDLFCSESIGEDCDLCPMDCQPPDSTVDCPECCGGWVCVAHEDPTKAIYTCEPPA